MLLLVLAVLLQTRDTTAGISGRGRPEVSIPRIEAEVVVDGNLDEPAWQQATRLNGFSQYEPVDGRPAEENTEILVWYAPNAIYFGIIAHDRQPGTIRATRADRDNIDSDDHVIIYLDTFNDRRRAFFFAVNPLGIQQDGVRSEGASSAGNIFGGSIDKNPDYLYESRGHVTDQGYVVEVRIPFKSLRYPGSGEQSWGINFLRRIQRTGYNDTWTDVHRASASFLLQAGTITGLHDLHRGVVVEAQPFVTASANGARDTFGNFNREQVDPEAGVNFRVGLTNLSLDATVNPDFSQVESDVSQVTVNQRFALFFPEKRPFFLEGIELFSTPNQLVYSRQIENPIAGAKVTGKFGNFGLAYLSAVDQVDEDGDGSNEDVLFNITRLRRDFGSNSVAGVTFTDRSLLNSPGYNRVLAGDVRYVFAKLYYLEGQVGGSWTTNGAGPAVSSPLWKLEFDRTGRAWGFNYQLNSIGENFITRSGFVNRRDVQTISGFNRLTLYGKRGAFLENYTTFFGPRRIYHYGDLGGDAIEGSEEMHNSFKFRGGWSVDAQINREFVDFDAQDYSLYEVDTGAGGPQPFATASGSSGPTISLGVKTPTFQLFSASASVGFGQTAIFAEAADGNGLQLNGSIALRPSRGLRVELSTQVQRLKRATDGSEFARSIIPRLKVEYQLTRSIFFRVVGDYVSQRVSALRDPATGLPILVGGSPVQASSDNDFRLDLLASFEPTPGTVAFFGYGSSMVSGRTLGFRDLERLNDGFFVKLAYQFRN
ncbi:MAG: DUF5916 domain-containing protein [Gemmatimonadota bacterium]